MKIQDITNALENLAPLALQESYDNAGLIIGSPNKEVKRALICLDATETILDEAVERGCDLVIAHHPIVFQGLKRLNGKNYVERVVIRAIQNDIAIYAIHTNLDNVLRGGVNSKIAKKLGLSNTRILRSRTEDFCKLITFIPTAHTNAVKDALFTAGAGKVGDYDHCSFTIPGEGSFRGNEKTKAYVGQTGADHREKEDRVEVIVPKWRVNQVVSALLDSHPYEEVAYDVYQLMNSSMERGSGLIGTLQKPMKKDAFLKHLQRSMQTNVIKHTDINRDSISTVAVCGGAGSFLIGDSLRSGADAYVTGDVKYHEFFDGENRMMICDIGHFESEQFTIELLGDFLLEKLPNFAVLLAKAVTNPVNYFH